MNLDYVFAALAFWSGARALNRAVKNGKHRLGDADDDERNRRGYKSRMYDVSTLDDRVAHIIGLIQRGRTDPKVVMLTRQVVSKRCGNDWCIPERDYSGEVRAIFAEVRKRVRYVRDAWGVDQFTSARRSLYQAHGGDCFPQGTLVLRDDHELVPIETLKVGERIWGLDRWSAVENVWYKGDLRFDAIKLNNGSWLHLTPDHKVYVAFCDRHVERISSPPCSCPMAERRIDRIRVSELQAGMVLPVPDRIPFGRGAMDPDRVYIEGLYLSDGSSSHNTTFEIAGQDGCPKEEQKRRVQQICERLGIPTKWYRKYISVKDKDWALRLHLMGQHAPKKHALSLDLDEGAAGALLRGIMADSGANSCGVGRTFTSTSRMLAVQTRLLHRMFGVSCRWSYIEKHGGLGKNPIYRLSTRDPQNRTEKLLRVSEIERGVSTGPAWDMTTDDHYVYLPEHDVTVSQCDDYVITLGSMLQSIGYPVKLRVIQTPGAPDWSHIYLLVGVPPDNPRWVPLDASVNEPPGWEAPPSQIRKKRDYWVT